MVFAGPEKYKKNSRNTGTKIEWGPIRNNDDKVVDGDGYYKKLKNSYF